MNEATVQPCQPLHRQLGAMGVLFLTISALSPAASVFVAGASVVHSAGTGAALGFLAGGVISAILALLYAELAAAFPHAGGPYGSVSGALGPRAGFVVQALFLVVEPAYLAFTALGLADYVRFLVPGISQLSVGLTAIGLATILSILNLRTNAWITGAFLAVELVAILIFSIVSLTHPVRPLSQVLLHPVTVGAHGIEPTSFAMAALAVVGGTWACSGASWAMFFGEELHDAPMRIGGVMALVGVVASVLIAAPIALFATSAGNLPNALSAESPFAAFLALTAGPRLAALVSFGVAIAIFNALIVGTIAISRMFYANGREGIFPPPVNRALTRVHGRLLSPWMATLILGVVGSFYCLLGARMNLLLLSGEVFSGALVALGVLVGRRLGRTGRSGYRTPLFPLVPIFGLIVAIGLVAASYADAEAGRPSMMILLAVIAIALGYYQMVLRPRGWKVHVSGEKD
ncbi:MAG: APC family permease [Limisphaerales bacterium]